MSGAQTYSEMINQPAATDAEVQTASYPVLIPGNSGGAATTKLATLAQLTAAITTGVMEGEETTYNATPIAIPNMPAIPSAGGKVSLQGQIGAYDTVTGDTATWNVALVVKRVPNGTVCVTVGDTMPSLFDAEGTLEAVAENTPPTLGANSAGPVITLTSLGGDPVIFDYNFFYRLTALSSS